VIGGLIAWLRGDPVDRVFRAMGTGIERRRLDLSLYWRPHFDESRRAQAEWLASLELPPDARLLVAGAGKLNDFEEAAARRFRAIELIDADPRNERAWKRLRRRAPCGVTWAVTDIAGCLHEWSRAVDTSTWASAMQSVCAAASIPMHPPAHRAAAIVSLSLLSQIPIAWQDAVQLQLWRRFGKRETAARESEWIDAVSVGARRLVERHLDWLRESAPRVLLITDIEYACYSGGTPYSHYRFRPPPLNWCEESGWSAEEGMRVTVEPALYGVDLGRPARQWLWHIAPLGLESASSGTVHRVGAFHWRGL
jgi:hypothetical protein